VFSSEIFFAMIYLGCGKLEFNYPLETTKRGFSIVSLAGLESGERI
jgi:hypothetical protein